MDRQDVVRVPGMPRRDNDTRDASISGNGVADLRPGIFKPIHFTGTASDYFAIWLPNLILSILTLGIYSAWAKVRRVSYFYNNTRLEGTGLFYHAQPKTILIGRILAFGALVILNLALNLTPLLGLALMPILLIALPWIMNRSMSFNARMTSWRNVRFQWHGTYGQTFLWMLIGPLLATITLGILAPWASKKSYQYFTDNHTFGTSPFSSFAKTGDYYKAFFLGAFLPFIVIALVLAGPIILIMLTTAFSAGGSSEADQMIFFAIGQFAAFGLIIAFTVAGIIYRALARNVLINALFLDDKVEFKSDLSAVKVVWITLSNLIVTVFTLGLMSAWAQVRLYRYICEHTQYCATGDIGAFIDEEAQKMGAFGEEFADLDGLEFGL